MTDETQVTIGDKPSGVLGEVITLAVGLEAGYHAMGWDCTPPTLIRVDRADTGEFHLRSTPLAETTGIDNPVMSLGILAASTHSPMFGAIIRAAYTTPPVATLFAFEGWHNDKFVSDEARKADPRELADIEGSEDCRQVIGLVGRHTIGVMRIRGREPEILSGLDLASSGGPAYLALTVIHEATLQAYRLTR